MLAWAQQQAEKACADIERADRQTAQAEAQYEKAADQGNATAPFQDPGAAARNQAQASLESAKAQVEEAAKRTAAALIKASEKAPPQPGPLTMLASGAEDVFQNVAEGYGEFWKGSFDGALDMLQQARALNPFDPYNLTHPSQYAENIGNLAASTVAAGKAFISDPIGTGKAMIGAGIDSFTKDPFGTLGKLAPEVAAGLATGGSSTAGTLGRRALSKLDDLVNGKPSSELPTGHNPVPAHHQPPGNVPGPTNGQAPPMNPPGAPHQSATPRPETFPQAPSPHAPTASRPESMPSAHHPSASTTFERGDHSPAPNHSYNPNTPQSTAGNWNSPHAADYTRGSEHADGARETYRERPSPSHPNHHGPGGHEPSAPETAHHAPESPPSPEQRVNEALAEVREHGDGIQKFDDRYDFEPGTDHLPEGLSRDNPDPFGNDAWQRPRDYDAPEFIHRNVDPSDDANSLWRAVHSRDLDEYFRDGLMPRNPDGRADIDALEGHVGGATNSRFVSATDSLDHALQRALNRPDDYGVILKLRSGGGIDVDATLHDYLGNSTYGYASHGEREFLLKDGAHSSIIEGAYRPISFDGAGKPTGYEWVPNPYFDPAMLRKGAR